MTDNHRSPVYVVLGATGGMGQALTDRLAQSGARLVLGGRNAERLQQLADTKSARTHTIEASQPETIEACIAAAHGEYGRVDGVANCIGSLLLKPAHLTKDAEWEETLRVNLGSAFATLRGAARVMMQSGGSVVLVSSAAARAGLANHEAIAAAKGGVIGLALSGAATYSRQRIRVNVVAPGLVRTPLTQRITNKPASEKASVAMHALGRLGEPADIARAMEWFLDPQNDWVTGQVLGVDGGLANIVSR